MRNIGILDKLSMAFVLIGAGIDGWSLGCWNIRGIVLGLSFCILGLVLQIISIHRS